MSIYATLAYALAEMSAVSAGASQTTLDNAKIFNNLRSASRKLDNKMGMKRPVFCPYVEARDFLVTTDKVDSLLHTFDISYHPFGGFLLAITSVVIGSTTLVASTDYLAYPSSTIPPYRFLRLRNGNSWYDYSSSNSYDPLTVTVTGIWGMHRDYANAWHKVDDLAADINASVTSLTVADVDGADLYGITPRISAGNLLRIGSEYLLVTATNTTTNVVTVQRGVNGSTAAGHSTGDDVDVWQVEEVVRDAVAKQAGLKYERRGAYTTVEVQGMSEVRFPSDVMQEVWAVVQEMQYAS